MKTNVIFTKRRCQKSLALAVIHFAFSVIMIRIINQYVVNYYANGSRNTKAKAKARQQFGLLEIPKSV